MTPQGNLAAAVGSVPDYAHAGKWHRVCDTAFLPSATSTRHTSVIPTRFYDPHSVATAFSTLYLSDHPTVAMFEAQALFGSPTKPGGSVPAPRGAWVLLTVNVQLESVVDLSDLGSQLLLDTNVQELTGDWAGYRQRSSRTNVVSPHSVPATTQELGEALYNDSRSLEGFLCVSAKMSTNQNLVVFPTHLRPASYVEYEWSDGTTRRKFRVDGAYPYGRSVP